MIFLIKINLYSKINFFAINYKERLNLKESINLGGNG